MSIPAAHKMEKPTIFIFYGVRGTPKENWFPWLKKELKGSRYQVIIPALPTPQKQTLKDWLKAFEPYEKHLTPETIFIGHSLGVLFTLNLIEKYPIKAAYLVAGFGKLPGNKFDEGMKSFARKFDWKKIRQNCKKFYVFDGDNDPYVKLAVSKDLAKKTQTNLILVPNGGHLNQSAGFEKFPLLLEKIQNVIAPSGKSLARSSAKSPSLKAKSHSPFQIEEVTFEKGEIIEITPDMIIGDVVLAFPETLPVLQNIGIHCIGCYAATFESIQEGVTKHGLDPEKVCKELNKAIRNEIR